MTSGIHIFPYVGGEKYSYASDYDIVTKLKVFADQYNICILLVHHTRKQSAEDCFETISGTNGLLGAADGAFIMHKEKRTDNKAVLDIVGRDQQDQRLYLSVFAQYHRLSWQQRHHFSQCVISVYSSHCLP